MSHTREIPPNLSRLLLLYRMVFPIAAAVFLPKILTRMHRRGGYQNDLNQRFGYFSTAFKARAAGGGWNWIHSISVGETFVAIKLAQALRKAQPDIRIALSVTTSTGYALAREAESEWLLPLYNPLDIARCVQRTLNVLRPERLIFIEGELWPNLMAESYRRQIPVLLANARLSPRSARRFLQWKDWVAPLLGLLEWISVPDASDLPLWQAIGVDGQKLHLTGSIKFDQTGSTPLDRAASLKNVLLREGIAPGAPLVVAGSTHAGEELLLARLLEEWRQTVPDLRLVLVPRHIERTPQILQELAPLGFTIRQRSRVDVNPAGPGLSNSPPDILLVDTTGELRDWYGLATVIFIGKSLAGGGGQNPVEAALAGKPVVFGPFMENFQTATQQLVSSGGALQVSDAGALEKVVRHLLCNPDACAEMSRNAVRAMEGHQGAAARTAQLVLHTPRSIL